MVAPGKCYNAYQNFIGIHQSANETKCDNLKGYFDSSTITTYNRVFIVAQVDDTHVYHIHLEIVPRLVYHLKFLQDNPDIRILYGCDTAKTKGMTNAGLLEGIRAMRPFLKLLGISAERLIIHKHVFARKV